MCTSEMPYFVLSCQYYWLFQIGPLKYVKEVRGLKISGDFSNLVSCLTYADSDERLTIKEAKTHVWISEDCANPKELA